MEMHRIISLNKVDKNFLIRKTFLKEIVSRIEKSAKLPSKS
jgi:hypothetical protein